VVVLDGRARGLGLRLNSMKYAKNICVGDRSEGKSDVISKQVTGVLKRFP